jgi:hypothetical protein
MTTIFYSMTLIFLGYELWSITHAKAFGELTYGLRQYREDKAITPELMNGCVIAFISGLYMLWAVAGLFSSNGKLFLLLILIGGFSNGLRTMFPRQSTIIIAIDAFICLVILCVIFINHFIQ